MGVGDNKQQVTASAVVGGALAVAARYLLYKRLSVRQRKVGKVSEIIIYPIKSGPALHVESAECTETGLKFKDIHDRQFIMVNVEANEYIPVRKNLKLLDLKLSYSESKSCLILDAPGMESLMIPLTTPEYDESKVGFFPWYDKRDTAYLDMGDEYAQWFTTYLGTTTRLGFSHPVIDRQINPKFIYNQSDNLHPKTKVLYANSHPFLIASQTSLEDLNTRLSEAIPMDSFRPNIIVSGDDNSKPQPYEEDTWREVAIGTEAVLYNIRACPRCPMIYVDYQKHEMRANKEPMTTLLKYRRGTVKQHKSKSVFGINSALVKSGVISVNDVVQA